MRASESCLNLIKHYEGLRVQAYRCPAGKWTIGYGHTANVHEADTCTPDQAERFLLCDVMQVEHELSSILHVPVTDGQWDALVSLAYNAGALSLPTMAPKLWAALCAGNKEACAAQFLDIDKGGGKMLPGLSARRKAEAVMFLA